jgi:hypothetical protein
MSNCKVVDRGRMEILSTQIHERWLSWISTVTSIINTQIHERWLSWISTVTSIINTQIHERWLSWTSTVTSIINTQIHERWFSWTSTATSIISRGVKIVLWDQIIYLKNEVWAHRNNLTSPLFIYVPVWSNESKRLSICV